jgi:HEAT repeat protein
MSEPEKPGSARERAGASLVAPDRKEEIQKHIKELLSDNYTARAQSINELGKYGEDAAEALVDTLLKKPDHPHALANLSDALAEIGKPSINVLLHALNHLVEVKRCEDVYVLESFVDLLGMLHDRKAAAPLLEQVAKLNRAIRRNHDKQLVHCSEAAKVRIHKVLIDLGEKGGLEDLLEMLGDGRRRVRDGVVETMTRIGDRRALVPLVRLHDIEEHVSWSGAQFIREAIREIARRERLGPEDRIFKDLASAEKASLERVFPKRAANGKH